MKRARRYAASMAFVALLVILFPFAFLKIAMDCLFDWGENMLESLEAIANDD
jgi:hypothetical protein